VRSANEENSGLEGSPVANQKLGLLPPRCEKDRIDQTGDGKHRAPPNIRVQIKKDDRIRWRMHHFPHTRTTNQNAVHEQRNPNEKPDRNTAFVMRSHRLIAPNADSTLYRATKFALAPNGKYDPGPI
jgi:hypothetical protein